MTTSFRVGKGIGIVFDATLAVFEPINGALAESLWALVGNGAGIDELLEELSSTGLRSLGSFAMTQFEESQTRVVVRGSALATVEGVDGLRVISANGVRTWVEEVVDGVLGVELVLGGEGPDVAALLPFRVERGLLPADVLRQGAIVAPTLDGVSLAWVDDFEAGEALTDPVEVAPGSVDLPPVVQADNVDADAVGAGVVDADAVEAEAAADVESPEAVAKRSETDPGRTMTVADMNEFADEAAPDNDESPITELNPIVEVPAGPGDEYDEIYGRTMARSVHSAAVHAVPEEVEAPVEPPAVVAGGLIQGIPPSAADVLGDHDGRTMTKAQIAAMKAAQAGGQQQPAPASTMGGPTVQAVLCPNQHPNPPTLSVCRVCFSPLTSPPVHIARPVLGSLRFSNGTRVPLDRPVLIGRNPKVEGGLAGEIPQLVRLDVGAGLSRTHASIRLEGWQVLLEDLNSANGTIVRLPGREPRRLHPSEPIMLEIGSDVDLGGEINCVFEA